MKYEEAKELARKLRKNQTEAESFFWEKVRNRRFYNLKFTRQFIVEYELIPRHKKYFIADFYCHEKGLIVEIDGLIHLNQKVYDQDREEILSGKKFKVIRFTNYQVLKQWSWVNKELQEMLNI